MTTTTAGSAGTPALATWRDRLAAEDGVWVFAYGSLMWRTDFRPTEVQVAQVRGWHRALSVYAVGGRGSPELPGLWLALEPGGRVGGLAMRLGGRDWQRSLELVWRREMPDAAYAPTRVRCELPRGRSCDALAFVANRESPLYAGALPDAEIARLVRQGHGPLGSSSAYVMQTVERLASLGIEDPWLARVGRAMGTANGG